jgi:predicted short-subunit dehydrogenase-like oxidoreductase (DUF2520 family)
MRSIRFIGPGRAGRALALAAAQAGWKVDGLLGRADELSNAAVGVDLLILSVPDDAIREVAAAVRPVPSTVVAHLSGSLGLAELGVHARRAGMHPLVPLPDPDLGSQRLRSGVTFALAGDPLVWELVASLGGHAVVVDDTQRAAYHAAACIAANHVVALLGQVERVAASAGLDLDDFLPLARAAIDDVRELGPRRALTGPASRGDWTTLAHHLDALDPAEHQAYKAGVGLALHLSTGSAFSGSPGESVPEEPAGIPEPSAVAPGELVTPEGTAFEVSM